MEHETIESACEPATRCQNPTTGSSQVIMSSWQLIFQQSKVNNGVYDGDRLPTYIWDWPQETWLQKRLRVYAKAIASRP
jgi:hypothetical protein